MPVNLTTTSHRLQITTTTTVSTDITASFRDNVSGVQTPGSQQTNVASATTADIVSVPGASTQRLVDDVEISVTGSGSQQVKITKFDGTNAFQLINVILQTNMRAAYTSDSGWRVFSATGSEGIGLGYSQLSVSTVITASGAYTYNPPVNCSALLIELWGGGGQAGGSSAGLAANSAQGSGGSGGCYSRKFLIGVPSSITGTVGAGGSGAAGTANGNAGAATTAIASGITYTANGGPGGLVGVVGTAVGISAAAPGVGSVSGTNCDENYPGEPGEPGLRLGAAVGITGRGGSCCFDLGRGAVQVIAVANTPGNSPPTGSIGAGSSGAMNIAASTQTAPAGTAGMVRFTPYSG